ncbi:MAG: hypothetical protein H6839_05470 [Planctomycetes bacterium]|nr:hypothetical protein [Planctomycetota bacterium]
MTLLIVEYVPYVAFTAAAGLVAWVAADVLRSRKRTTGGVPETTKESGRGLAGPAQPLTGLQPEVEDERAAIDEVGEATPDLTPAEELHLPVSQARDLAAEDEQTAEAEEPAVESTEENEPVDDAPVVAAAVIPVRRDPSVRVFDTAVAASERKVMSPDD